ncbi:MAG: glycerol-3-phosphate acyltransferase PlsY [Bacteroidia bacterium]|jgi:glycerol-3-phosphate acyltransferase PlsY
MEIETIVLALAAYFLGSIPTAVWVSKGFHGLDIREHGSKSAGATNTFRVLGKKSGYVVLFLDIVKGFTAANLAYFMTDFSNGEYLITYKIIFGLVAVIGHLFPILAGFKGGKGIATLFGMILAINPLIAMSLVAIFLFVQLITNLVSAGSIVAALAFPLVVNMFYRFTERNFLLFAVFAAALVLYTHRANIKRILAGDEKKIHLFGS